MNEVSLFRLYVLRAMYLFIVAGLGVYLWPGVLNPHRHWELNEGMATCMLAAFSLLCLLGLRYPLQMLPVLLWEVIWKTLWLILVPLRSGRQAISTTQSSPRSLPYPWWRSFIWLFPGPMCLCTT
jgi:hypothetical protein